MKSIILVLCLLFAVPTFAQKAKKITKKEIADNYAPNYVTVKYDVSGLFSKSLDVTLLNSNPNFTYVNLKLVVTYYDSNKNRIKTDIVTYNKPLFPNVAASFSVNIDVPKTAENVTVIVDDGTLVRYVAPKQAKTVIRGEWE